MTPRNLQPTEDTKYRNELRAAGWIPMMAKFPGKCMKCGSTCSQGSLIVWHKSQSKVMHYNSCALDFVDNGAAPAVVQTSTPAQVSIGPKKAARPSFLDKKEEAKEDKKPTTTVTAETTNVVKETANEQSKPARRKFGFVSIKPSDLGK